MTENTGKRAFHEDIFAEDNEKWSWPLGRTSNASSANASNYDIHAGGGKDSSSCASSEEDLAYKGDSTNSLRRSFRKRGSSSASEEHAPEDVSSSPGPRISSIPHERLLPSIYDDDAQSGSPSGVFEKKDLAFRSSFNTMQGKSYEISPSHSLERADKMPVLDQDGSSKDRNSRNGSPSVHNSPKKESRDVNKRSYSSDRRSHSYRSVSKSRDGMKYHPRSRSRSRSRDQQISPRKDSNRSHSHERNKSYKRSRSPKVARNHSPRRSPIRDVRRRSHSRNRDVRKRSRSREIRRRSRSRSYDRRRRRSHRSSSRDRYRRRRYSRSRSRSRDRSKGSGSRKPGSLPLSTSGGAMTPQMALQQTMAAMSAKAQAMTGIALPKYYNPAAVNPLKYAEQVQKRKLLWQTKEKEADQPKNTVWDKLTFDQDQDGKMTAKFRKLMGIKSEGVPEETQEQEVKESVLKKQAELFRDLDQQYEMARVTTHTQRGVGLGYSATSLYPPVQK